MKNDKEEDRRGGRETGDPLILNLWPLIMFILVLIVFLLRISLQ